MLDSGDIEEALESPRRGMAAEGIRGELLLTGGAVMTLVLGERGSTDDVDAAFSPRDDIKRISWAVSEELGLPRDWLSDSVRQFLGDKPHQESFRSYGDGGALTVTRVSDDYLLAMKMMAIRYGTEDVPDIARLCARLGITEPDQAMDVLYSYFPARNAPMGVYDAVVEALGN